MSDDFDYTFRKKLSADEDRVRLLISGIIAVCVLLLFVGWAAFTPDSDIAIQVVRRAGLSEGRVTESGGPFNFRCSSDDSYYYRVEAKNPKGDPTLVTVCCGVFKDCTVRY